MARMASAVDDLSGGRLTLGLGAGWQPREHHLFGFALLDLKSRFERFEESLEVTSCLLKSDQPVTFEGKYFQLHDATLLPRPQRSGGAHILIGGNGEQRTLRLAARYADEWNANFQTPASFAYLSGRLDELLKVAGRKPESVRRSMMTGVRFAQTRPELERKLNGHSLGDLQGRGLLVGTGEEIRQQLALLEQAGVERVMLQWKEQGDLDGLSALAKAVL
jgi:alkanesulfonate monooxygenase SsuD/methylene tetrahydromethanopterin reductase-like flavin-dependent oxidoreductase (luciferase family)